MEVTKEIKIWIITYLIPSIIWIFSSYFIPNKNAIILEFHILLVFSIIFSYIFLKKYNLRFKITFISIVVLISSMIVSFLIIWKIWIIYSISSILQELSMLFICYILLTWKIKFYFIYLMISLPFIFSHDIDWAYKIFILWFWSFLSLYSFSKWLNIFYIISLHIIFWSILINMWLIYK